MIINFYNVGGGGGGGTTNYNDLSNKPSINSVTLSGNVTSDQLGITMNELQPVQSVPSAATNGSIFAVVSGSNMSLKQVNQIPYCTVNVIGNNQREWTFNGNFTLPSGDTALCLFYFAGETDYYFIAGLDPNGFYLKHSVDQENWTYDLSGQTSFDDWVWDLPAGQWYIKVAASGGYILINNNVGVPTSATEYTPAGPAEMAYINYVQEGGSTKWFDWSDNCFIIGRENCSADGDYRCQINNDEISKIVRVVNGVIDNSYGQMTHVGDGYYVTTIDNIYHMATWISNGKIYWRANVPISNLDAYDTGSGKEGGIQMV